MSSTVQFRVASVLRLELSQYQSTLLVCFRRQQYANGGMLFMIAFLGSPSLHFNMCMKAEGKSFLTSGIHPP